MLQPEEIQSIIDGTVQIIKDSKNKKDCPEYTSIYKRSVEMMEKIMVHSQLGNFPHHLFKKRAPNQTDEEFEYLEANFKTTTLSVWTRYAGVLSRIWHDANWSIKWPESWPVSVSKDETPQQYFNKEYPTYGSLETFFKDIVTPYKEQDSNGVLAHKPKYIPTKQVGEEIQIDTTKRVEPIACYYTSKQVVGWEDDYYCLILTDYKTYIKRGNSTVKEGLVFEFYDNENIWRIEQKGVEKDYEFEYYIYYNHALGYLPVQKLKGRPIPVGKEVLYQSNFLGAVENLDLVLLDSSYLIACKAAHAFPQKWSFTDECDYFNDYGNCVSGKIVNDKGEQLDCPSCKGTGKKKPGLLGEVLLKVPTTGEPTAVPTPPFGFVAPDPTILKFLRDEMNINTDNAMVMLNLGISSSDVKGSETALGKQIDREELFSFIKFISDQVFDLYEFSYKCLMQMRYGKETELPVINAPKTFSIRNEADLTLEISEAKDKGLPDIAIRNLLNEYMLIRFGSQGDFSKYVDLVFAADRLITLTTQDIIQKKVSGTVAAWEDILHTSIYSFITDAIIKDSEFLNKDIQVQIKTLVDMSKAKAAEISPAPSVDNILSNANA